MRRAIAALWALLALACSSPAPPVSTADELRARAAARGVPDVIVPFEVTDAQIADARDWAGHGTRRERLERLAFSIEDPRRMALHHIRGVTTTAQEAIGLGRGNCLALGSIVLGLARGIGLDAHYVDASEHVNEVWRSRGFSVQEGHIAVAVDVEKTLTAVDFDGELEKFRDLRPIDDLEAIAHFYNNRAFDEIQQAELTGREVDWRLARAGFETAVRLAPDLASAWNNLGVAEAHAGNPAAAERAYRNAIDRRPGFASPHNNLGKLALDAGRLDEALRHFTRAVHLERDNPQFLYNRGYALYRLGQKERALQSLRESIRRASDPAAEALLQQIRDGEAGGG